MRFKLFRKDPFDCIPAGGVVGSEDLPTNISIGANCTPALTLRELGIREASFPFDWVTTPLESVIALFRSDFQSFMDLEEIEILEIASDEWYKPNHAPRYAYNRKCGIAYHHELTLEGVLHPDFVAKYRRRIERMYRLFRSGTHIRMVRLKKYEFQYEYTSWNPGRNQRFKDAKVLEAQRPEAEDVRMLNDLGALLQRKFGTNGTRFDFVYICSGPRFRVGADGKVIIFEMPLKKAKKVEEWSQWACRKAFRSLYPASTKN